jgi:hypothetical protein
MKRAQILIGDLILGAIVFIVAYVLATSMWESSYAEIRAFEDDYEMNWISRTVAEQLVRTGGEPHNWSAENAIAYGLAYSDAARKKTVGRVLDPDKTLKFIDAIDKNYTRVRNSLLGSGKFDFYVELRCLNDTGLKCLQGLELNRVADSVSCANTNIYVSNRRTDNYYFFEAEEVWSGHTDEVCEKGCSGGNMSLVHEKPPATVNVDPGRYRIWARTIEEDNDARFHVGRYSYPLYVTRVRGHVNWNLLGEQDIGFETIFGFSETDSGTTVDAILLTTDMAYDPRFSNSESFGNPKTEDVCIVGLKSEGANIVSSRKTAVMMLSEDVKAGFMGAQQLNNKALDINVVLYEGIALPPRDQTTTTTTIPPVPELEILECLGPVDERCTANQVSLIEISGVSLYDEFGNVDDIIECGQMKNMSIYWRGSHMGDPNYFAFFINDDSNFLGSCESENEFEIDELNHYDMRCNFTANDLTVGDGVHQMIVTGEDILGYCNASDRFADAKYSRNVRVKNCIDYEDINCDLAGGYTVRCDDGLGRIEDIIDVEIDGDLVCGTEKDVTVLFRGRHSDAKRTRWTFVIGGSCIARCRTDVAYVEDEPTYYRMSCTLPMDKESCSGGTYSLADGSHDLYVIGFTGSGYCDDFSRADAYLVKSVSVSECS